MTKMGQREYVRRQAEKVGLQIPLFFDEKPDKAQILRDQLEILQQKLREQGNNILVDAPPAEASKSHSR
jgi:hypothetical protein